MLRSDLGSGMNTPADSSSPLFASTFDSRRSVVEIPLGERSDEDLMRRVRQDDRAAYKALIGRHLKRSFALARRICGNDSEAEDVTQDVFMRIWQHRDRWEDDGAKFTTWLYRIVTNRSIDFRRKPVSDSLEPEMDPPDHRPDVVHSIQKKQVADRLTLARERLPDQQRVAVALYYFNGLSAAEAAAVMNISLNALESLLKRARKNLRETLRASARAARDSFDDG